jgi:hypothetical protein
MKKMTAQDETRAEIKKLYNASTPATVEHDLRRAIELLKGLAGEAERARVAVYMDGLAQLRSEWRMAKPRTGKKRTGPVRTAKPGR